jgi:5-(carboxyamino)imidazole ribonucleotide synthase
MSKLIHQPILPPAVIGVFGSGQLGRMLALAARTMGYRIHTFSPDHNSPTGQVAEREICAPYTDLDAVRAFVRGVDVVTFEFENVAAEVAQVAAEEGVPVRPGGWVLHTTQQRLREKQFLSGAGLPVAPFAPVRSRDELAAAITAIGAPAVLKTAAFGYDGKGQVRIDTAAGAHPQHTTPAQPPFPADPLTAAFDAIGGQEAILEAYVDFACELSVVAARSSDGSFTHWGVIENRHRHHILDLSLAPAAVEPRIADDAVALARAVVEQLDVIGVLCVEMFLDKRGRLLINELAPRPHNSGHLTIDASITSQFEQQLRAVCGLPLGATEMLRPAAMANLLGDLWVTEPTPGTVGEREDVMVEPDWAAALAYPNVKLHLYGKHAARAGRKMGHLTAVASTIDEARDNVLAAREALVCARLQGASS